MTTHKLTLTVPAVPKISRRFALITGGVAAIAVAVVLAVSALGGSANRCAIYLSHATTWAQNYIAPMEANLPPNQVKQEMARLSRATARTNAAQDGLTCY